MTRKLRILHVLPYHPLESASIFSKRQIRDLTRLGHENELFFLKARFNPLALLSQYKLFRQQIETLRPDLIHAHYGTITAYFASWSYRQKPFVVSFQGSDLNMKTDVGKLRNKLGRSMSAIAARRAKLIFCVSESLKHQLAVKREEAIVLPAGIDQEMFRPLDRMSCIKKLGLDPAVNYVFFNANNPKIKRLDIATDAISRLSDLNVQLLSLNGNTAPDEIPWYLNACRCLLLCSDNEGSPMVIKEAMACNLPVVAVNVGDVQERIQHVSGCFITEQNAEAIAAKIRLIIEKNSTGTNGREELVRQQLDSMQIARIIEREYLRIAGG